MDLIGNSRPFLPNSIAMIYLWGLNINWIQFKCDGEISNRPSKMNRRLFSKKNTTFIYSIVVLLTTSIKYTIFETFFWSATNFSNEFDIRFNFVLKPRLATRRETFGKHLGRNYPEAWKVSFEMKQEKRRRNKTVWHNLSLFIIKIWNRFLSFNSRVFAKRKTNKTKRRKSHHICTRYRRSRRRRRQNSFITAVTNVTFNFVRSFASVSKWLEFHSFWSIPFTFNL